MKRFYILFAILYAAAILGVVAVADAFAQDATPAATTAVEAQPPILNQPVPVDPNIAMWQIVLGVVSSLAVSTISRRFQGDGDDVKMKRALTLGAVCLAVAVFDTFVRGVMNTSNYMASFLTVTVSAITFYKGWSATSGLAGKIEGRQ